MLRSPLSISQKDGWFLLLGFLGCLLCLFSLLLRSWWLLSIVLLTAWLPFVFVTTQTWWTSQNRWMAFLFLFLIAQSGHFVEHCAQMVQLHIIGLPPSQANGMLGMLNVEWVHFIWNTIELLASLICLYVFSGNPWRWLLVGIASWHEAEHAVIMSFYLRTHIQGSPGLLAHGGLIAGGLPLIRPDLHFLYVLIEQVLISGLYFKACIQYTRSQAAWGD